MEDPIKECPRCKTNNWERTLRVAERACTHCGYVGDGGQFEREFDSLPDPPNYDPKLPLPHPAGEIHPDWIGSGADVRQGLPGTLNL